MPFAAYMREHMLEPLGMDETTILQPVPEPLAGQISLGYSDAGHGEFEEEDFEYVPLAPVGAVSSSADDMARLMIAYLQDGRLGDARILTEETARRMRQPLFRHADGLNAALYGFMDMSQMGQTIYGHGGDTFWFHTLFALLPEHDVGVFLSYNTDTGAAGRERFLEAFLERYFPVDEPPALEIARGAVERAERYAGNYRVVRYTQTDFTKIAAALGPLEVSADSGALTIDDDPTRYLELSPGLYREEEGHGRIAFRDDEAAEPAYLFIDPFQIIAFERVDGVGSPAVQAAVVLFSAGVFLLALIFWPYVSLLRWRYGATPPEERRLPRWARVLSWTACLGFLAFAAMLGAGAGDPNAIAMGDLEGIRRVLTVGLVAALLGAITAALGLWFWLTGRGSVWTRVVYSAVGVACLLAIWQMSYWNLLGFRL
ncbi:MAG: serine hydrolase, partial [Gemmatimonadota bacterium]|nr:serine hydrolase [Gemmatimonadota bacterium]